MKDGKQNKKETSSNKKAIKASEFFLHDLREHSKELFGVKPEILDGAFLNVKDTKITKDYAQRLINDFLKKEVK